MKLYVFHYPPKFDNKPKVIHILNLKKGDIVNIF